MKNNGIEKVHNLYHVDVRLGKDQSYLYLSSFFLIERCSTSLRRKIKGLQEEQIFGEG